MRVFLLPVAAVALHMPGAALADDSCPKSLTPDVMTALGEAAFASCGMMVPPVVPPVDPPLVLLPVVADAVFVYELLPYSLYARTR